MTATVNGTMKAALGLEVEGEVGAHDVVGRQRRRQLAVVPVDLADRGEVAAPGPVAALTAPKEQ